MRYVLAGGGSGGHIYPALAVAAALPTIDSAADVLYLGSASGPEADLVRRVGIPFAVVAAGPLRQGNPLALAGNGARMVQGTWQARGIMSRFRPQAVLVTGGYVSAPVALGGRALGIPLVIFLPDIHPGLAIRSLARLAKVVAATSSRSRRYLPGVPLAEVGYPVRPEFAQLTKSQARAHFHLEEGTPTLLVLGGSQGARSINVAMSQALVGLLELGQIIHISGPADLAWLKPLANALPPALRRRYHLYPYLHEDFPCALAAADLAVSRAGASVLGEFPAVGLPSILVPYPYAGGHQEENAQLLTEAGAALKLDNRELPKLLPAIRHLLQDRNTLAHMAAAARSLARPQAAQDLAELLARVAQGKGR